MLEGFSFYWDCTLLFFFRKQLLADKRTKTKSKQLSVWWTDELTPCLWCLVDMMFSSAEGGRLQNWAFSWCDLILHRREAKRKNLVICQSKILFLSPQLKWNTWIDIESRKELTRTQRNVRERDVRLEVQQEQNLHVKPPGLFCDWQPIRKAAMFYGRVGKRPLLCRPPSHCSVGEKAAQTDDWDSFDYATD